MLHEKETRINLISKRKETGIVSQKHIGPIKIESRFVKLHHSFVKLGPRERKKVGAMGHKSGSFLFPPSFLSHPGEFIIVSSLGKETKREKERGGGEGKS